MRIWLVRTRVPAGVPVVDTTATFDLLKLQNGASAIFGDKQLAVGQYTQIRLIIGTGSNVMVGGVSYPIQIPSGLQTGLKLNRTFNIAAGQLYELTLNFNADKSIQLTGSNTYKLNPVIRVEATVISGTVSGIISPAAAKAIVSAINGTDAVSTAADTLTGAFKLMALPAGTYDVAILPQNILYADTTVANVPVIVQQNTNIGTITLRLR